MATRVMVVEIKVITFALGAQVDPSHAAAKGGDAPLFVEHREADLPSLMLSGVSLATNDAG
jgi:hypothetical protein